MVTPVLAIFMLSVAIIATLISSEIPIRGLPVHCTLLKPAPKIFGVSHMKCSLDYSVIFTPPQFKISAEISEV